MICHLGDLVSNQCPNLPPERVTDLSANFTVKQPLGLSVIDHIIKITSYPLVFNSRIFALHSIFLLGAIRPDELALEPKQKPQAQVSISLLWLQSLGGGVTHMLPLVRHHGTQERPRADLGCLVEHALKQRDGHCIPGVLSHIRPREICFDHARTAGVDDDSWASFNHGCQRGNRSRNSIPHD